MPKGRPFGIWSVPLVGLGVPAITGTDVRHDASEWQHSRRFSSAQRGENMCIFTIDQLADDACPGGLATFSGRVPKCNRACASAKCRKPNDAFLPVVAVVAAGLAADFHGVAKPEAD